MLFLRHASVQTDIQTDTLIAIPCIPCQRRSIYAD